MSIFDAYDQEYNALMGDIGGKITELKSAKSSDKGANNTLRHTDALLMQATDLVKQMEIEIRSHDPSTKKKLGDKVMEYKKTLASQRSEFERAKEQLQRSSLIGDKSSEHRQRLLNTNDKLERQNEMIMNAQRTVAETEEVGLQITEELGRNREKIQSAHSRVHEFTGITDSARRVLSSMQRRDVQQKMMLGGIALIILIAIIITAVYASKKK